MTAKLFFWIAILAPFAAANAHSAAGKHTASQACGCECCETEYQPNREYASCVMLVVNDPRFLSPYHDTKKCTELCTVSGKETDTAEFCLNKCVPLSAEVGALCQSDKNATHPKVMRLHQAQAKVTIAQKQGEEPMELPPSIQGDRIEIGAEAEEIGQSAAELSREGVSRSDQTSAIEAKNRGKIGAVQAMVSDVKSVAVMAHDMELSSNDLLKGTEDAADQAAEMTVNEAIKTAVKKAQDEAYKVAKKIADERKAAQGPAGKAAAAAAAKPYMDAMGRAAAAAGAWQAAGDGAAGVAFNLQAGAQLKFGAANQYQQLGDTAKAQATLQEAHMMMDTATSLTGAANGQYNTATGIMGTLGGYAQQAAQAAYHAEVMKNPDAPPPPAPLV